jgi:hypothetical protein
MHKPKTISVLLVSSRSSPFKRVSPFVTIRDDITNEVEQLGTQENVLPIGPLLLKEFDLGIHDDSP